MLFALILFGALVIYNHYSPPSVAISVGFHFFAAISFLGYLCSVVTNSIKNRPIEGNGFRFWVSNSLSVLLAIGTVYLTATLTGDVVSTLHTGYPRGRYVVRSATSGLYGVLTIQNVVLENLDNGTTFSGSYIFRADLLRVRHSYDIVYGPKSEFIFLASPITK